MNQFESIVQHDFKNPNDMHQLKQILYEHKGLLHVCAKMQLGGQD